MKPACDLAEECKDSGPLLKAVYVAIQNCYPDAIASLVFGSQISGGADSSSDTDIMVLFDSLDYEFHEMRRDGGILLDAHVMTLSGVRSKIRSQMASRGCFYIKALKDGVIIHDSTGCMRLLQAEATAIFFARPAFSNWMSIRLNLSSRLRDMDHSWTFVERTLIGAEMVKSVMCIWALRHRGWAARMDVMRKWAVEDCPDRIFALDEAFTRMISGQSEAFKSIVIEALDDIGGVIAADERIRKRI